MRRALVMMLAVLPGISLAEMYIYPDRVEPGSKCTVSVDAIIQIEADYSDPEGGADGKAKVQPVTVDLNGDGRCEIFLNPQGAWVGTGRPYTAVLTERDGKRVHLGDFEGSPDDWWYGVPHNGYVRIFVPTYLGHRANPEFITTVLAFDGERYVGEPGALGTHGYYMDAGLKAYRAGDFATAELHYKNAYRMNKTPPLADANNLALVWTRQGKLDEARALLERHLANDANSDQMAAAYFNLGIIDERQGNRAAALRNYTRAHAIAPTPAREAKLREFGGDQELRR